MILDGEFPFMGLGQLPRDCQPQSHPLFDPPPDIPLIERLEQIISLVLQNAFAMVPHEETDAVFIGGFSRQVNFFPVRREFDCVTEQISDDLVQTFFIRIHIWNAILNRDIDGDITGISQRPEAVGDALQERLNRRWLQTPKRQR